MALAFALAFGSGTWLSLDSRDSLLELELAGSPCHVGCWAAAGVADAAGLGSVDADFAAVVDAADGGKPPYCSQVHAWTIVFDDGCSCWGLQFAMPPLFCSMSYFIRQLYLDALGVSFWVFGNLPVPPPMLSAGLLLLAAAPGPGMLTVGLRLCYSCE